MTVDRRRDIIQAATNSFSLYGYKATTMSQVAKQANVGKGTIYTFFKNKEQLFNEIFSHLIKEMEQAANEALDPNLTFKENLHLALYEMLEFRLEHKLLIKLAQEERDIGTPIVQHSMKELEQYILSYIEEKIKKAIAKKEIKECRPDLTAFILFKLYIALIFDWERERQSLSKKEIADLFEQYVFDGLSNSPDR